MTLLWVALISLLGSALQASTGFGYAIVCMGLWPFFIPFKSAAVVEVITALLMVMSISLKMRRHINYKLFVYPLITATVTGVLGVFILVLSGEELLRRVLGAVLFLLSVYFFFFSGKIKIKPGPAKGLVAGTLSGLLGGMFNIGGPPVVVYFLSSIEDKMEYNATLQFYFTLSGISILGMHLLMHNFNSADLGYSVAAAVGMALGVVIGSLVFKKISIRLIKAIVYLFMAAFGVLLLVFG